MWKHLKFGLGKQIFTSYILLLVFAMILCGALVSGYVTNFLRHRTAEFNSKSMATVVYELDSMYQRIEQFSSGVYEEDITSVMKERKKPFDYNSLKSQIEFEEHIKNSLQVNNLKNDIIGIMIYIGDDNYYYVGEGITCPELKISEKNWYKNFKSSKNALTIIGPIKEDYRPSKNMEHEAVLFISRLNTPLSIHTNETPFVMTIVRYETIRGYLDSFFGSSGALVSDQNYNTVYSSNLTQNQKADIRDQMESGMLAPDESGLSVSNGKGVLITGIRDDNFGWTIYSINPSSEIFKDSGTVAGVIVGIFVLCSILGVVLAWYISKSVMVPIKTMNQMISQMEESENTFIDVQRNDEVGQIGQRFNSMKQRLQQMSGRMYLSEVREKQAQLQALQSQINPHFLYNTLDNIYCIALIKGEQDIATLTENLGAMMRYSIDTKDAYSTLEMELAHVKEYIAILNLRHDEAIRFEDSVDVGLYDIKTMKLLLQPLVENAWIHGISQRENQTGSIKLGAEIMEGKLLVSIQDDGVGMDSKTVAFLEKNFNELAFPSPEPPGGIGIGMKNVHDRIRLAYGDEYGIKIESRPDEGTKISIWLKY